MATKSNLSVEEKKIKKYAAAKQRLKDLAYRQKWNEYARKWQAEKRKNDPEYAERQRQASRKWGKHRQRMLETVYQMTLKDYDSLFQKQGGVCAICGVLGSEIDGKNRYLHVDHDHKTGVIRGLLCNRCNTGLASFDRVDNFGAKAATYLSKAASPKFGVERESH